MSKRKIQPASNKPAPSVKTQKPTAQLAPKPPISKTNLIYATVAALLGFVLYANTFGFDYCLDDFSAIKDNFVIKGGLKNLGTIFTTEYRYGAWAAPGSLYRPLSLAMFAAEWGFAPDKPFLSHLINVLFYSLTGVVLFFTLRRLFGGWPSVVAAGATLIFMAHPAHSEVVSNIKSRDEILAFLGCLGAIYCLWRSFDGKTSWLVAALVSYTVALFSKESAITFLAVIPLAMWFFTRKTVGEITLKTLPFVVPAVVFLGIRAAVLGKQPNKEIISPLDNLIFATTDFLEQKASACMMVARYFQSLVFPTSLVSEIGYPQMKPVGFSEPMALVGLAIVVGLVALFFWGVRRRDPLAFAAGYFLATFSIYSNLLILIGTSYGERLLYAPSLGLAIAIAFLIAKLLKVNELETVESRRSTFFFGIIGLLVLASGIRTVVRNGAWKDSYALYTTDIQQSPNSAKLNYHFALELAKRGVDDKTSTIIDSASLNDGIAHYSKAIALWPTYRDAFAGRGLAFFRKKQYDRATEDYNTALKYDPNDAKVLSNMGFIYFLKNDLPKAEEVYRRAVKADPRFVDAWRNLGASLAMQKRFAEAIPAWQEALKFIPPNDPTNLAQKATLNHYIYMGYRDMGRTAEGEPFYQAAIQIDPKLPR